MSWYSDGEPFDEWEPEYCKRCEGGTSKAECDRCQQMHREMEVEMVDSEASKINHESTKGGDDE